MKLSSPQRTLLRMIAGEEPEETLFGYKRESDGKMCFGFGRIGYSSLYKSIICRKLLENGFIIKTDETMIFQMLKGDVESHRYIIKPEYLELI